MKIPDLFYEKSIIPSNCRYLLGIDEVGRGPLAGPVTVAGFLLDLQNFNHSFFNNYIRDSKSLSPNQRFTAFKTIIENNYSFHVVSVDSEKIDAIGIQLSIIDSIKNIIGYFKDKAEFCLIDGKYKLNIESPHRSQVKADLNCFSVAAASICAKVTRDKLMFDYAKIYPQYGFEQNKGYGTATHIVAIKKYGPCPIHRRSFKLKNFSF